MANKHYLVVINECGTWVLHNSFRDREEASFEVVSEKAGGVKPKNITIITVRLAPRKRLTMAVINEVLNKLNKG